MKKSNLLNGPVFSTPFSFRKIMTDLHDLCKFGVRPVTATYVENLRFYLKSGIPSTYTVEEAYNFNNNIEDEPTTFTTPLHLICTHLPQDLSQDELVIANDMVSTLFEYGAGWCLTDINNDTPGCILIKRNLKTTSIYDQIVDAGVRAELLLRKVSEYDVEFIDDAPEDQPDNSEINPPESHVPEAECSESEPVIPDTAGNQADYLLAKLEYTDDSLITKDAKDGVMMSWETELMRIGCDTIVDKGKYLEGNEEDLEINILNIGFGMGIIDSMIQAKEPTHHYICEAHPDVLKKLSEDGWFEKKNVTILSGRWQDTLNELLSQGNVFFNGIYYDTFSEHYSDMLELFDFVVGLLKPHGVFSFFNGLGADRQVIYEVYKKLVTIDLNNYGLECKFTAVTLPEATLKKNDKSVWEDVKRSYWSCPVYYHPEIKFIEY